MISKDSLEALESGELIEIETRAYFAHNKNRNRRRQKPTTSPAPDTPPGIPFPGEEILFLIFYFRIENGNTIHPPRDDAR
jgi:hypothetical protein